MRLCEVLAFIRMYNVSKRVDRMEDKGVSDSEINQYVIKILKKSAGLVTRIARPNDKKKYRATYKKVIKDLETIISEVESDHDWFDITAESIETTLEDIFERENGQLFSQRLLVIADDIRKVAGNARKIENIGVILQSLEDGIDALDEMSNY